MTQVVGTLDARLPTAAKSRLWAYFLGATMPAAGLAALLPATSPVKLPLIMALCLAAAVAFAFGVIRGRPARQAIWWLPFAGQVVNLLVTLAWTGNVSGVRGVTGFTIVAGATFAAATLLLIAFLILIARTLEPTSAKGNRVDTLIVSVGIGTLWFEYLIWPYYEGHQWSSVLPSAYTLVGLALIFAAVRMVLARASLPAAKTLLLLSVAAQLTAIAIGHWNGGEGLAGAGPVILLAWFVSFALQAALALHPSMTALTRASESTDDSENRTVRVITLTLAALIPVYAELIHDLRADGQASDETVIVGAAAVLFVLVALRINGLMVNVNEHRRVLAELKLAELARAKSLEEIAASEEQYRLVVAGSFDSILILDAQGNVIDCNPAGEAMFGFNLAEIVGRDASEILFPPADRSADFLSSSLGRRVELMGIRGDGTEFPIELAVTDLRRRQDRLLCVTIRDLTDRMQAEQSKRESDAKSRFLSTMSHELRTPLNSILGFAQLSEPLVASHQDGRLAVYMKNILVSGWHLLTLINDVLDFSGVQSGQLKLNPTDVILGELVKSAAAKMEPIANEAGVKISYDVGPDLVLEVDPLRLEQVLLNLLSNAVKFTSTGVWLRATQSPSGVAISVKDDGDGIVPELQERVFEEFVQLQSGSTRAYDGVGLGLPISRRLVEAMGGTVQLESHPGTGATFTVRLPVSSAQADKAS